MCGGGWMEVVGSVESGSAGAGIVCLFVVRVPTIVVVITMHACMYE